MVERYPISIAVAAALAGNAAAGASCRAEIRAELGLPPDHLLGVGVDRLDYTKGILERFLAVERMLELHPELIGTLHLRPDRRPEPLRRWRSTRPSKRGCALWRSGSTSASPETATSRSSSRPNTTNRTR